MSVHYICWFSQGSDGEAGFVPTDGGCHHEEDRIAWEMSEVLRNNFGINFAAFVPVLEDMGQVEPALLPGPERCLEVFSEAMRETLAGTEQFMIKDIFNQPKQVSGQAVVQWLDEYRKRWGQGYFLVRVPDK